MTEYGSSVTYQRKKEGKDKIFTKSEEKFSRCRAYVLQAINAKPGMTYSQIRQWIQTRFKFTMEGVGPRCRELYVLGYARRETENNGRVHVYPVHDPLRGKC